MATDGFNGGAEQILLPGAGKNNAPLPPRDLRFSRNAVEAQKPQSRTVCCDAGFTSHDQAETATATWKIFMHFVKRYWIAGLVLALVGLHAAIIGHVRSEATRIKLTTSSEIPVGVYYVQSPDRQWMSQLRIHVMVPPAKRLAAKATIERNRWLIHEAVEERLHQLSPELLQDTVLLEVKGQIKLALEEALQESIIERVLVNDRVDIPIHRIGYPIEDVLTRPEPMYTSQQDVANPTPDGPIELEVLESDVD